MAKITRKTALIFAESQAGAPANEIAVFGSDALGVPAFNSDPAAIQTAQWLEGWIGAVLAVAGGVNQPALEDRNAVDYVLSYQIAYLLQQGIPEYDAGTTYFGGPATNSSICMYNGVLYQSIANNNVGNEPDTSPTAWVTLASLLTPSSQGIAKAWVYFSGSNSGGQFPGEIFASYNVVSITVLGTGIYQINFTPGVLADGEYCVVMGEGQDGSGALDFCSRYAADTKTATELVVRGLTTNGGGGPWGTIPEMYVAIFR